MCFHVYSTRLENARFESILKTPHITSINAMVKISKWYKQKRPPPRSDNVLLTPQNLLTFA